jgi:hypothetical protein
MSSWFSLPPHTTARTTARGPGAPLKREKDAQMQKMTQHVSLEEFCGEEPAEGGQDLLATAAAAASTGG